MDCWTNPAVLIEKYARVSMRGRNVSGVGIVPQKNKISSEILLPSNHHHRLSAGIKGFHKCWGSGYYFFQGKYGRLIYFMRTNGNNDMYAAYMYRVYIASHKKRDDAGLHDIRVL